MLDIVGFMFWDFSGMSILDQRSFLTGRIGTQLFGENITIWDDVAHPLQNGAPFDGEGMQRKRCRWLKMESCRRVVYARATAERMKRSEQKDKVGRSSPPATVSPCPTKWARCHSILFLPLRRIRRLSIR